MLNLISSINLKKQKKLAEFTRNTLTKMFVPTVAFELLQWNFFPCHFSCSNPGVNTAGTLSWLQENIIEIPAIYLGCSGDSSINL